MFWSLAGPPGVCIDDNGNERKVSHVFKVRNKLWLLRCMLQLMHQLFVMNCVSIDVFQPGESWLLEDGCHSLLCHPSGVVTVQNHKVSCDRLEPPACRNNMPPVRVQETCGCHWECPCMYTKASNSFYSF